MPQHSDLVGTIDLLNMLPDWFLEIGDFRALMDTEEIELAQFALFTKLVKDNFFVQTCDLQTLEAYEDLLAIPSDPDKPIAVRRWLVLLSLRRRPPFSLGYFKYMLNEIIGAGNYDLNIDYANYALTLAYTGNDLIVHEGIEMLFIEMLPAHITHTLIENIPAAVDHLYTGMAALNISTRHMPVL